MKDIKNERTYRGPKAQTRLSIDPYISEVYEDEKYIPPWAIGYAPETPGSTRNKDKIKYVPREGKSAWELIDDLPGNNVLIGTENIRILDNLAQESIDHLFTSRAIYELNKEQIHKVMKKNIGVVKII